VTAPFQDWSIRRRVPRNQSEYFGFVSIYIKVKLVQMSATRYWTSYWKRQNWPVNEEYGHLRRSRGAFRKRGVSIGDVLYIISQRAGQLLLGGRMTVGRFVAREEAVRISQRNLYDTGEWVVAQEGSGTLLRPYRQLMPDLTKRLRFGSGGSALGKALLFIDDRNLDPQTTRGVRGLTTASATLLDDAIELTDNQPRLGSPVTISDHELREYRARRDLALVLHEELRNGTVYLEGSVKQVLVNRYERDLTAREECIRHYGTVCSACKLDLNTAYGEVAAGFIHVHHLIKLSTLGPDYVLNPVDDLRPVCPNCHAIIHRRDPPYSIGDVQRFMESGRSGRG